MPFIERTLRHDAISIGQRVGLLLKQGACIGLFPEGTTTDGKQVGYFHSALIQPAIDAGVKLCPIALRYQGVDGGFESAAAFVGDMTLAQSIWQILRCPHLNALVAFTPLLMATNENRCVLARAAHEAIAQRLQTMATTRQTVTQQEVPAFPQALISSQPSYALLADPLLHRLPK